MPWKVMRWLLALVAGICAFLVSALGCVVFYVGLGFWGPVRFHDVAYTVLPLILPLICFPLWLLFIVKPKWGLYAFLLFPLSWIVRLISAAPQLDNPLSSGLDQLTLLCVCSVGVSYAAYRQELVAR